MIRISRTTDVDLIAHLERRDFGSTILTPGELARSIWWVARDKDAIAAWTGLQPVDDGTAVFLVRSGVASDYRGRGLHRRLIRTRIRHARTMPDVKCLITYTDPSNATSANNLISCGFRVYTPAYAWVGREYVYFRKVIR